MPRGHADPPPSRLPVPAKKLLTGSPSPQRRAWSHRRRARSARVSHTLAFEIPPQPSKHRLSRAFPRRPPSRPPLPQPAAPVQAARHRATPDAGALQRVRPPRAGRAGVATARPLAGGGGGSGGVCSRGAGAEMPFEFPAPFKFQLTVSTQSLVVLRWFRQTNCQLLLHPFERCRFSYPLTL